MSLTGIDAELVELGNAVIRKLDECQSSQGDRELSLSAFMRLFRHAEAVRDRLDARISEQEGSLRVLMETRDILQTLLADISLEMDKVDDEMRMAESHDHFSLFSLSRTELHGTARLDLDLFSDLNQNRF